MAGIFKVDLNYFISDFNSDKKVEEKDLKLAIIIYMVREIYTLKDQSLNFGLEKCIESIYAVAKKQYQSDN